MWGGYFPLLTSGVDVVTSPAPVAIAEGSGKPGGDARQKNFNFHTRAKQSKFNTAGRLSNTSPIFPTTTHAFVATKIITKTRRLQTLTHEIQAPSLSARWLLVCALGCGVDRHHNQTKTISDTFLVGDPGIKNDHGWRHAKQHRQAQPVDTPCIITPKYHNSHRTLERFSNPNHNRNPHPTIHKSRNNATPSGWETSVAFSGPPSTGTAAVDAPFLTAEAVATPSPPPTAALLARVRTSALEFARDKQTQAKKKCRGMVSAVRHGEE